MCAVPQAAPSWKRLTLGGTTPSLKWAPAILWIIAACAASWIVAMHVWQSSRAINGTRYFWLDDDQMVSMRYARHLADGHGLVWNVGERVEGYSDFLWVLVMALVHVLGASDAQASVFVVAIGLAFLIAVLWQMRGVLRCLRCESQLALASALAASVCCIDIMSWVHGGFSIPLSTFLHLFVVRRILAANRIDLLTGVTMAILPLVRDDMMVLWVSESLLLLVLRPKQERIWTVLALTLVPAALHEVFRIVYYGEWLPNTYYLKVAGRDDRIAIGLHCLWSFGRRYALLLMMAICVSVRAFRQNRASRYALLVLLVPSCIYVAISGDNFRPLRHLAPSIPIAIAFAAAGTEWIVQSGGIPRALWATLAWVSAIPYQDTFQRSIRANDNGRPDVQIVAALWLRENASANASVAVVPAGIVPYFSRRTALDVLGKNDKYIARLRQNKGALVGHGKFSPNYTLGKKPDYVVSCRPVTYAESAATLALADRKRQNTDYVLSLLASDAFQQFYLSQPVRVGYLEDQNAIFMRKGSPEVRRLNQWRDMRIER